MGSEHYCLRWNNHQSNLLGVFSQLLEAESLVDVTLASSEGHSLRAHKVVLSACSSYFRALFLDHPARHPIVILKDVCFSELRTLVEFMYRGEVSVETCRLSALLKTAESLKVKGLAEMTASKGGGGDESQGGEGSDGGGSPKPNVSAQPDPAPPLPTPPTAMEQEEAPKSPQNPRDDDDASSVQSAPSDATPPAPSSPHSSEPVPGPSGLPPVQDAPLSLKKEVDWDREDKSMTGESSSDYKHPHDPEVCLVEGEYGPGSSHSLDQISSSSRSSPFRYPGLAGFAGIYGETVVSLLRAQGLDVPGVRCTVCLAAFPTSWLLDRHIQMQHPGHSSCGSPHTPEPMRDDKPFRCDQCGQSYRYRSAYIKHREQNHRARLPADKLFTCDVCGMQFRYLKSFKKHRLNHTLERLHASPRRAQEREKEEEPSEGQDEVTSSNEAVGRRTEASDQDDTVDSVTVEAGEPSLINLLRLNERARPPRSFACPFCGKCVRSKENLKLHVRKHTGERPFACLFCGRAFGGKSDLTRHLRIHTGERPYHCEMCGKCFARADYLSKHLTTHIHQGQHR